MRGLRIRTDLSETELRALARRDTRRHAAPRLYAIAHVFDGMSQADAARLCGVDRQALRDAVVRYNVEGAGGLADWPPPGRRPLLTEGAQAALAALIFRGPDPERKRVELDARRSLPRDGGAPGQALPPCQHVARGAPPRLLAPEGPAGSSALRCQRTGNIRKRGLQAALDGAAAAHPDKRMTLWFEDEARVGQKGRTCLAGG